MKKENISKKFKMIIFTLTFSIQSLALASFRFESNNSTLDSCKVTDSRDKEGFGQATITITPVVIASTSEESPFLKRVEVNFNNGYHDETNMFSSNRTGESTFFLNTSTEEMYMIGSTCDPDNVFHQTMSKTDSGDYIYYEYKCGNYFTRQRLSYKVTLRRKLEVVVSVEVREGTGSYNLMSNSLPVNFGPTIWRNNFSCQI